MAVRKGNPFEEYELLGEVGKGSFGDVQKGVRKKDGTIVAIKRMKKKYSSLQEVTSLREYRAFHFLSSSPHQNLLSLHEAFLNTQTKEFFFVMEYCEGGNLYQFMKERREMRSRGIPGGGVSPRECWEVALQVLEGLKHMHCAGLFHRDMKPENVLITYPNSAGEGHSNADQVAYKKLIVKIADFGLAREIKSKPPYTEYVSTRWYRAPEVLLRSRDYGPAVDLWAVGVILVELISLRPLFPGKSEVDQVWRICEILGSPGYCSNEEAGTSSIGKRGSWGGAAKKALSAEVPTQSQSAGESRKDFETEDYETTGGGDWREGIKLANKIGFSFPSIPPKPLELFLPTASPNLIDLLANLLRYDPKQRPTAEKALQFAYFREDPEPKPIEKRESIDILLGQLRDVGNNTKISHPPSPTSKPTRSSLDVLSTTTDSEKENRRWSYQGQDRHRRESSMSSLETSSSSVIGRNHGRKRRSQLASVFFEDEIDTQSSNSTRPSIDTKIANTLQTLGSLPDIPVTSPMLGPIWSDDAIMGRQTAMEEKDQKVVVTRRSSTLAEAVREYAEKKAEVEEAAYKRLTQDLENRSSVGSFTMDEIPTSLINLPRLSAFLALTTHQPLSEDNHTDWLLREIDECVRAGGIRTEGFLAGVEQEANEKRLSATAGTFGEDITMATSLSGGSDNTTMEADRISVSRVSTEQANKDSGKPSSTLITNFNIPVVNHPSIGRSSMLGAAIASSSAMLLSTSAPTSFYTNFNKTDDGEKASGQGPARQVGFNVQNPVPLLHPPPPPSFPPPQQQSQQNKQQNKQKQQPKQQQQQQQQQQQKPRKRLLSFTSGSSRPNSRRGSTSSHQPLPTSQSEIPPVPPLPTSKPTTPITKPTTPTAKPTTPNFQLHIPIFSRSTPSSRHGRNSRPSTSQRNFKNFFGIGGKSVETLVIPTDGNDSINKGEEATTNSRKSSIWSRSRNASPIRRERKKSSASFVPPPLPVGRRGSDSTAEANWDSEPFGTKYNTVGPRTSVVAEDGTTTLTHYGVHLHTWAKHAEAKNNAASPSQSTPNLMTDISLVQHKQEDAPSSPPPPPRSSSLPCKRSPVPDTTGPPSLSSISTTSNGYTTGPSSPQSSDMSPISPTRTTISTIHSPKEKRRSGGNWFSKFNRHVKGGDSSMRVETGEIYGQAI